MRDRLIELIDEKQVYGIDQYQPESHNTYLLDNDELADHLLANGVIVPVCKVGDKVYENYRGRIIEYLVHSIEILSAFHTVYNIEPIESFRKLAHQTTRFTESKIGKTIFLTREEAENAR